MGAFFHRDAGAFGFFLGRAVGGVLLTLGLLGDAKLSLGAFLRRDAISFGFLLDGETGFIDLRLDRGGLGLWLGLRRSIRAVAGGRWR
jgi:hypothetical protein